MYVQRIDKRVVGQFERRGRGTHSSSVLAPPILLLMAKTPKRPRDPLQLAKLIGDIATGQAKDKPRGDGKDPAAVTLGRRGGLKGGAARKASLTPEQRQEIARLAAQARWKRSKA